MLLIMIRALFVLVVAGLGVQLARIGGTTQTSTILLFAGVMVLAVVLVVVDWVTPRKKIQTISAIYFGIVVGVILSDLIRNALAPTMDLYMNEPVRNATSGLMMVFICYLCISTLLQTKDDFRFIIPYMEFSKEVKGARPLLLDTSVVIDGRIADVAELADHRPAADRPPLRPPGAAGDRRQLRQAPAQPGPSRARHPQPAPEVDRRRGQDPRLRHPRTGRHPRGRSAPGRPGQAPRGQGGHQRLQPEQDRAPAGGRRHQPERPGQRHAPHRPAGRRPDRQADEARRGARPGDRLPRRRDDGRDRAGGQPPRRDRPADRHERLADQRRADDLRPDRPRRPRPVPRATPRRRRISAAPDPSDRPCPSARHPPRTQPAGGVRAGPPVPSSSPARPS